ncbi:interleukin 15, like isoform X2 [Micropterus salmoides]|uniref:interleukin 15, like isoform X2 n=1 Tax=Micropterus salmoides TaxID=27706 RepID=UPI0018ECD1CA|nr:interleukin 15, like isoform X2 [Micropterus salmoides]
MLRGRPAFASVYLCFVCLLSLLPSQLAAKPCTRDILKQVKFLVKLAPSLKSVDCRLYTPTIDDYQKQNKSHPNCLGQSFPLSSDHQLWFGGNKPLIHKNCPSSTLKCFADEIKVLIEEWSTVGKIPCFTLNISLTTLASKFNQTESECRQCELFREEEAENFLKGLQLTLEMMNSQHCVRIRRTRRNYQN